jgi:hypothetical protein
LQATEWLVNWSSATNVETWPEHDIIEHKHKFTCPCNPKVETFYNAQGQLVWHTIHNSFDEYLDDADKEPYKGL